MASGSGLRAKLVLRVPVRGSRLVGVRLPQRPALRRECRPLAPQPTLPPPGRQWAAPLRLRLLLMLLGLLLCGRWIAPRALAYWQLHNAATEFSDYALCMVGSGGPELLWRRPTEFWQLVRRRVLAAPEDARPFAACAPGSTAFPDAAERRAAHRARARDFLEYATALPAETGFSLGDLEVSARRLHQLARSAEPLLRKDPGELLRPSLRARSAPLLFDVPQPALGRGLPAADLGYASVTELNSGYLLAAGRDANLAVYWSRDGGRNWSSSSAEIVESELRVGTCSVARARTSFRLAAASDSLQLESWQNGQLRSSVPLAPAERRLLAFSCDAEAVVAVLSDDSRRAPASFRSCPALGRCKDLPVPAAVAAETGGALALSAARSRGAIILALSRAGIVRIFSSRDEGRTWMPPVVAYDAAETFDARFGVAPTRLLSLGDRVLLYAGAEREHPTYAVLASDDLGASWHAP